MTLLSDRSAGNKLPYIIFVEGHAHYTLLINMINSVATTFICFRVGNMCPTPTKTQNMSEMLLFEICTLLERGDF